MPSKKNAVKTTTKNYDTELYIWQKYILIVQERNF